MKASPNEKIYFPRNFQPLQALPLMDSPSKSLPQCPSLSMIHANLYSDLIEKLPDFSKCQTTLSSQHSRLIEVAKMSLISSSLNFSLISCWFQYLVEDEIKSATVTNQF
ncbi:hypothetical protein Sjap_003110 [Stephania japonica]|uniref:Uncharacterized protein n=1 Tax=Stephania japonica TaxID=461633 RepID=A0AAP0KP17_9MAGN